MGEIGLADGHRPNQRTTAAGPLLGVTPPKGDAVPPSACELRHRGGETNDLMGVHMSKSRCKSWPQIWQLGFSWQRMAKVAPEADQNVIIASGQVPPE